jgi:hypothetical protein
MGENGPFFKAFDGLSRGIARTEKHLRFNDLFGHDTSGGRSARI